MHSNRLSNKSIALCIEQSQNYKTTFPCSYLLHNSNNSWLFSPLSNAEKLLLLTQRNRSQMETQISYSLFFMSTHESVLKQNQQHCNQSRNYRIVPRWQLMLQKGKRLSRYLKQEQLYLASPHPLQILWQILRKAT